MEDLLLHLDTGFKLMNTVVYLEETFGKLLCLEFLESLVNRIRFFGFGHFLPIFPKVVLGPNHV